MNEPARYCNSEDDSKALADPDRWVEDAVARCGERVNHAAHPDWQAFCTAAARVLAYQGLATLDDPKRMRNALNDHCKGAFKREVNISILCASADILAQCARHSGTVPAAFHIRRMVSILTDEHGVAPDLAAFIASVWSTLGREFCDPSPRDHASASTPSQPVASAISTPTRKADDTHTVDLGGGVHLGLVWCPAGSFQMGSNDGRADEKPVRSVQITKGFWMGKTEVTQAQWRQLMNDNPSHFKGDDRPVERVDWHQCVKFCRTLTDRERTAGRLPAGYVYRLPTEAEWEYAARGGSKSRGFTYSGGNDLWPVGWYTDNSGDTTHPVGKKAANELGLYDMSGNVWEWCQDWYQDSYKGLGSADPSGPATGSLRVLRGGGWFNAASGCRSALRFRGRPSSTGRDLGFRVVLAPVP